MYKYKSSDRSLPQSTTRSTASELNTMAASAPGTTSRSSLLLLPVILLIAAVGLGAPSSSLLPLAAAVTTVNGAANGRGVTLRIDRRQVRPLGPCRAANHRIYLLSIYSLMGFPF